MTTSLAGTGSATGGRLPATHAEVASGNLHRDLCDELRLAVIHAIHDSGVPYCILGDAEASAPSGEGDLDFAVTPSDYDRIPQLLADAAAFAGGQLVQAIAHESTATYFAIAKVKDRAIGFVNPDCTTDYRREGRLWIPAEELLRGRRLGSEGFFRPAPDTNFKYYLIKQVLKQTLSEAQWARLTALYYGSTDPECALNLWPEPINLQMESALLRNDGAAFHELLPRLGSEVESTPYREDLVARGAAFAADSARLVSRVSHPTGLFVRVAGGLPIERTDLALRLAQAMAPAFRHTWVDREFAPASINRALIESTLVVSLNEAFLARAPFGGVTIHWQPALSPGENLEQAIAAVASYLSRRTAHRLKLSPRESCPTTPESVPMSEGAY